MSHALDVDISGLLLRIKRPFNHMKGQTVPANKRHCLDKHNTVLVIGAEF